MRKVFINLLDLRNCSGDSSYLHDDHYKIAPMISGLGFWTRRKESPRNYMKLLPLLSVRRGSGCKLPSDLMYSLLGAAWDCPDVEVDYNQPFEVVFARVARQIIDHDRNLSIFCLIERKRKQSILPTWVPEWRTPTATTGFSSVFERYYVATGSSQIVVRLSDDAKTLSVRGLKLYRIIAITSPSSKEIQDWVDKMFNEVVEGKKFYRPTNESLEEALRRARCLDMTDFGPENPVTRWRADSHAHFEQIQTHFSDGRRGRMRYAALLFSWFEKSRSKGLIVTGNGRLGMAPEAALEGDIITLLLGGEVPIVLRSLGDNGDYTLVGECYVHGVMDGEGLAIARQVVQPDFDRGDTSWLQRLHEESIPFPTEIFHIR